MLQVELYDTTLRDGAQQEGISFSVEDKLKIVRALDSIGVDFVEGGWPGSNPKDTEFFEKARKLQTLNAKLVAFGSTRRHGNSVEKDDYLRWLLEAGTEAVTIVGKCWDEHVARVLGTTLAENLAMIKESVAYLKSKERRVFFDAEHFFDGYKANPEYSLETLACAVGAGAECVILCDTNGGTLSQNLVEAIISVQKRITAPLGIHAHNDAGLAVANSLAAVQAGVKQVHGTINGYGERCGNANMCSIIPNLKIKMGSDCVSNEQLQRITEVSHYISELANLPHYDGLPYVGANAFAHKAGMHVAGILKWEHSYQHVDPLLVGNSRRVSISELSGVGNIIYKAKERGVPIPSTQKQSRQILEHIKFMENQGFQYDSAEASFDLLLYRVQDGYCPPFELVDFMVVVEKRRRLPVKRDKEESAAEATIKIKVDGEVVHTAAEGDGPVNALDQALRKALLQFYPALTNVTLTDYKVRILEETAGTASQVRVLIESSDGKERWRTVGSSTNIIEASWLALVDSFEYWLIKQPGRRGETI